MSVIGELAFFAAFAGWLTIVGSYSYFCWRVAPSALGLWAEAEGYRIVSRRNAGIFDRFTFANGSGHQVYRVVVVDKTGQTLSGLVRVGEPYRWCLSVNRCPVEARWDEKTRGWPGNSVIPLRCGMSVTPRTVLSFAVADFVFATIVLAMELLLLSTVVMSADEIYDGALGLNRYFGRVPRPGRIDDTRMVMFQSIALSLVLLPALVTLTVGGIGLIRRRMWGYHAHVAGSVLVAVTCFGLFYTIPALVIARCPEFKEFFLSPAKTKSIPPEFEDL